MGCGEVDISRFQEVIRETYIHHDRRRGLERTLDWLVSEVYELRQAIEDGRGIEEELADVLAWLASVANLLGIDLEKAAVERYGEGCPKCGSKPCGCQYREGPDKDVVLLVRTQS